jgi:hypothetical protein
MRYLFCIVLASFGVASGLFGTEMLLRLLGEDPGPAPVAYSPANFTFREPFTENQDTGWELKPGNYQLVLGNRGRATQVSINSDGSRTTRSSDRSSSDINPKIFFIGDSYVFGEGLDDDETLPWRIQERLPHWNVINQGVGGYGTCQAFLRLQQLQASLTSGDKVVYGLSAFHEERNTADPRLDYWAAIGSPSHRSGYPRCELLNNTMIRKDSRVWNVIMPLTGRSVLSKIITQAWLSVLASTAMHEQRALTDSLLQSMKNTADNRGASFIVLLQEMPPEALLHYKSILSSYNIDYVDGAEATARRDFKLPDGHPGPETTKIWAKQLSDYLVLNPS